MRMWPQKNQKHRSASICVNAKYDGDKMNPFMSDRSECDWFVGPEIHMAATE